jgi:arginyl-tRNA--protein-N-Asp/Glu arginylyltransferase
MAGCIRSAHRQCDAGHSRILKAREASRRHWELLREAVTKHKGAQTIRIFKNHMLSVLLAVAFSVSGMLFFKSYVRHMANSEHLRECEREIRIVAHHVEEQARKRRVLARVERFVQKAKAFGLQREGWDVFEVTISRPVTYAEAMELLSQTENTSAYYFRPVELHIKKEFEKELKEIKEKKAGRSSGDEASDKGGDIYMTLKGKFLVRQK